ncbi:solute carrier family 35 member F6-like isoform X3 [Tachypleus tridentatus]|uniref:solute carrier family 35 member F6-like isoform X3 n=1 Tax=Tachypleus tridentatus TaxID=6853 RepID=UPI003FD07035
MHRWTKQQIIIAIMMVATGSINTLATKWADMSMSEGKYGTVHSFDHPFLQATGMFLGELSCLAAFKLLLIYYNRRRLPGGVNVKLPASIDGNRNFNPLIFLLPAMCDMLGTSVMYIGLNMTNASSFQMFRGDLLIVCGQVITATQMVVEEKFITKHNVAPLQAVGWEGLFGFTTLTLLQIPMYYIPVGNTIFKNPDGNLEDAIDGFYQIGNNWQVAMGVLGTVVSIAFFNFAGISITKEISATTRMVLDSVRTLVIWVFSMTIGWESFVWIQLVGFIVLLGGMWLYNDNTLEAFLIKKGFIKPDDDSHLSLTQEEIPPDTNEEKGTSINTNGSLPL